MKSIKTLLFTLLLPTFLWAQSPQNMSYQAVIRDAGGQLLDSSTVGIQISILQGSSNGTPVYVETHQAVTNSNGLLSLQIGNGTIQSGSMGTINWANGPFFLKTETDPSGGSNYTIVGSSPLLAVPYALHARIADSIQGGMVESDPLFSNSVAASISAADTARWGQQTTNTDNQTLSFSGSNLSIQNGNTVDLSSLDTDTQIDSLGIANFGYVAGPHTIDTQIDSSGIASFGYVAGAHTVDTQIDSTGIANLGYVAGPHTIDTDTQIDSTGIANFGFVAGSHTVNTDNQTLSLSGTNLSIANGNSIDLSAIDTDTQIDSVGLVTLGFVAGPHTVDTDDQTLSLWGTNLSIANGNTIDLSAIDTDTDDQTLSLSGTNLSIANGNSIDLSAIDTDTQIDSLGLVALGFVAGAHTVDTDDQTLSLSGTNLSIANGNTIDLSAIDTDTDDQTLSLSGTNLSIANGNSIDLSAIDTDTQIDSVGLVALGFVAGPHTVDTDDQTLTLSGTNLSIANGNTIDLSTIDTDTDDQTLSLSGTNLSIANGNTLDLSSLNTDNQSLTLSGTNLSIANGNTIDLSAIDTDTDDQTLSLSGTNLSIANGNTLDLSSIDTDTQLDSSGIAALGYVAGNHVAGSDKQLSFNDNGTVGADAELVYDKSSNHMAIGSATVNPNAALEIKSTSGGLLLPRMTTAQRDALSPEVGTIIFNTDSGKFQGYTGFPEGVNAAFEDASFLGSLSLAGQSFTATADGIWTKLMLNFQSASSGTLNIYSGNGASGTPIHTQAFNVSSGQQELVLSSPIQLTSGQQYTFTTGVVCEYYPFGSYSGGTSYTSTIAFPGNLWFKVFTGEAQWENLTP